MYYLSSCVISKDENQFLEELIVYHQIVGFEHFYIYDNGSKIPIETTLKKYVDSGLVTVINFPGKCKQFEAYNHCLNNYGQTTKWMSWSDTDEFFVPKQDDDVKLVLQNYEMYGGFGPNWVIFGSSGHIKRPKGLQMENYTKTLPYDNRVNRHIKTIVNCEKTIKVGPDPHHAGYKQGFYCVNENSLRINGAFSNFVNKKMQINHYFLRSKEDFEEKVTKGRADSVNLGGRTMEEFFSTDRECLFEDKAIQRFLPAVKKYI